MQNQSKCEITLDTQLKTTLTNNNNNIIADRIILEYVGKYECLLSSFLFQPVMPKEVKLEISLIPNNKSYGLYSSPTKLLKLKKDIIAPVISEIFNTSFILGIYPSKLKMAKTTPIFKSDDETDANNYRPISLLSKNY